MPPPLATASVNRPISARSRSAAATSWRRRCSCSSGSSRLDRAGDDGFDEIRGQHVVAQHFEQRGVEVRYEHREGVGAGTVYAPDVTGVVPPRGPALAEALHRVHGAAADAADHQAAQQVARLATPGRPAAHASALAAQIDLSRLVEPGVGGLPLLLADDAKLGGLRDDPSRLFPLLASFRFSPVASLNHLIRARQQRGWDGEAERLGGLEVDHKLELRGLLDGEICRPGTLQDPIHVARDPNERV